MASENVDDWDCPIHSSTSTIVPDERPAEERRQCENLERLNKYVNAMAYRPTAPPVASERIEHLAPPKKMVLIDNYRFFCDYIEPKERAERMKRTAGYSAGRYTAISTEQFEQIIKSEKAKERKKESLVKRKQEIYYDMLTKLENQCRNQYLNLLIKKFATFIAKLATTMRIPPQLVEPYSRMQRGIFCNILMAIGVKPSNQAAAYYTTEEATEYEVCHKLAHAILSLIIKGLDTASTLDPDDLTPLDADFQMDNYIKDRLMCAAEKKLIQARRQPRHGVVDPATKRDRKCDLFADFPVKLKSKPDKTASEAEAAQGFML